METGILAFFFLLFWVIEHIFREKLSLKLHFFFQINVNQERTKKGPLHASSPAHISEVNFWLTLVALQKLFPRLFDFALIWHDQN